MEFIQQAAQLGGTVFVVAIFIWYLRDKNGKTERNQEKVANALSELQKSQEIHTKVLIRVANNHGLRDDADDLMTS